MFKLFNTYPLSKLLKKVQFNARLMFITYSFFICAGIISFVLIINDEAEDIEVILLTAIFIGATLLLVSPFLLYDYFHHKNSKYSLFMQDVITLDMWDSLIFKSEKIGDRLGVSENYIFSSRSTFYIPCYFPKEDIKAIYSRRRYRKRWYYSDPSIYIISKSDKLYKLPLGYKFVSQEGGVVIKENKINVDEFVLSKIHQQMPDVLVGTLNGYVFLTKNPDKIKKIEFTD